MWNQWNPAVLPGHAPSVLWGNTLPCRACCNALVALEAFDPMVAMAIRTSYPENRWDSYPKLLDHASGEKEWKGTKRNLAYETGQVEATCCAVTLNLTFWGNCRQEGLPTTRAPLNVMPAQRAALVAASAATRCNKYLNRTWFSDFMSSQLICAKAAKVWHLWTIVTHASFVNLICQKEEQNFIWTPFRTFSRACCLCTPFFLSHVHDFGLNYPRHLVPLVSGSSAQSACEACAPGKYMLSTQSSECLHCEPGKFSTSGLHLVALCGKRVIIQV
jgi:hypothetical protein